MDATVTPRGALSCPQAGRKQRGGPIPPSILGAGASRSNARVDSRLQGGFGCARRREGAPKEEFLPSKSGEGRRGRHARCATPREPFGTARRTPNVVLECAPALTSTAIDRQSMSKASEWQESLAAKGRTSFTISTHCIKMPEASSSLVRPQPSKPPSYDDPK
eukprot:scaffold179822_cov31-Tisochrysis_lutea.AAC.4